MGFILRIGSARDAAANLAVLCESCHDKVHAKEITIGPLVQSILRGRGVKAQ
jgi:predicted HNH restriction endonuclease